MSRFFKGGLTFEYANDITIPELLELYETAKRISIDEKAEIKDQEKYGD